MGKDRVAENGKTDDYVCICFAVFLCSKPLLLWLKVPEYRRVMKGQTR